MKDEARALGADSDGPGGTYPKDTGTGGHDEGLPTPPLALMPTRAFADSRLRRVHLAVLGALCSFNNYERSLCFPSHPSIGERSGYHVRNVRKALQDLWEWEYVDWVESFNPKNGQQRTHNYMIHFDEPGASPSPIPSDVSSVSPASPLPTPLRDGDPAPWATAAPGPASGLRNEHVSEHVSEQVTEHVTADRVRDRALDDEETQGRETNPATKKNNTRARTVASDLHVPGDVEATRRKQLEVTASW